MNKDDELGTMIAAYMKTDFDAGLNIRYTVYSCGKVCRSTAPLSYDGPNPEDWSHVWVDGLPEDCGHEDGYWPDVHHSRGQA